MVTGPYPRPFLEIEFDQPRLVAPGCCRFVPVVVRLCGVPEKTILTVTFERVRKKEKNGTLLDDYEVRPHNAYDYRVRKEFPGYYEFALQLLARGHDVETGTIQIKLESHAYTLLTEGVYRLDSRQREPVQGPMHKGSFRGMRFVPYIRTLEERDALCGQFPSGLHVKDVPLPSSLTDIGKAGSLTSLFDEIEIER